MKDALLREIAEYFRVEPEKANSIIEQWCEEEERSAVSSGDFLKSIMQSPLFLGNEYEPFLAFNIIVSDSGEIEGVYASCYITAPPDTYSIDIDLVPDGVLLAIRERLRNELK